ncbi:hypothetical protein [Paraburkholderia aspalathi]|uniref:hypothetical protein n=1 Tax=Paraburkholderia aspalathi TaxID=1324617 RepID=UPI0038BD8FF8
MTDVGLVHALAGPGPPGGVGSIDHDRPTSAQYRPRLQKWFAGRFACVRTPQKCRNIYKYDKGIADISIFLWKKDYFCRIQTPKWLIGANDR